MAEDLTTGSQSYEFTPEQEKVIGELGLAIRVVGLVALAYSLAGIILLAILAWRSNALIIDLNPMLGILIGIWALTAGRSFTEVASTKGNDIPHLMTALGKLRSIFKLIAILMVIALVIAAIVLLTTAFFRPEGASITMFGHPVR